MGIKDRNIDAMRQSRIIPASEFSSTLVVPAGTNSGGGFLTQLGGTAPGYAEISTFGFGLPHVDAAGNTWAALDLQTPRLINPDHQIGVRVHYMTIAAVSATDDITFIVLYDQWDAGEALVAPATALNTVIAEHRQATTTTLKTHRTARGVINAGVLDWTSRSGGITWDVEADAMDYSANEIAFMGLEIDYMPKYCWDGTEDIEFFATRAAI